MNKKHVWQGSFVIVVVVFLAYTAFTGIPYSVSKSYDESIYNATGQVVKSAPVTVSGKVYRGIFKTNEFIGKVNIDGETYAISTFRNRRFFGGEKNPYPYMWAELNNEAITTATIEMAGDFNSIVASTDRITKEFGKGAELTGTATSTVSGK